MLYNKIACKPNFTEYVAEKQQRFLFLHIIYKVAFSILSVASLRL